MRHPLCLALLAVLLLADALMTMWAVKHGYYEKNKLMVWIVAHPPLALVAALVIAAISCGIVLYLWHGGAVLGAWIAWGVFTLIAAYPVIHGIVVLARKKRAP